MRRQAHRENPAWLCSAVVEGEKIANDAARKVRGPRGVLFNVRAGYAPFAVLVEHRRDAFKRTLAVLEVGFVLHDDLCAGRSVWERRFERGAFEHTRSNLAEGCADGGQGVDPLIFGDGTLERGSSLLRAFAVLSGVREWEPGLRGFLCQFLGLLLSFGGGRLRPEHERGKQGKNDRGEFHGLLRSIWRMRARTPVVRRMGSDPDPCAGPPALVQTPPASAHIFREAARFEVRKKTLDFGVAVETI